jgi:hypothetical protein
LQLRGGSACAIDTTVSNCVDEALPPTVGLLHVWRAAMKLEDLPLVTSLAGTRRETLDLIAAVEEGGMWLTIGRRGYGDLSERMRPHVLADLQAQVAVLEADLASHGVVLPVE